MQDVVCKQDCGTWQCIMDNELTQRALCIKRAYFHAATKELTAHRDPSLGSMDQRLRPFHSHCCACADQHLL